MSRIAESAGAITIAGPANVFQHRLQEAQVALDDIRPFGVFDEEPAPGFARGVRHIEKPDLGLQRTGRHTRLGFQLEASTTMLADPFALVRMAVALEPDIADVLSQRKP